MTTPNQNEPAPPPSDFIRDIVAEEVKAGKHAQIRTRFPPEPNGYLHIGHAKSICLNFGIAHEFGGVCNIRMDDTNPAKEETEYVDSIMADVRWLIGGWADKNLGGAPLYTSDYFDKHYEFAIELVRKGKAYVDEMPAGRGDEGHRDAGGRRLGEPDVVADVQVVLKRVDERRKHGLSIAPGAVPIVSTIMSMSSGVSERAHRFM